MKLLKYVITNDTGLAPNPFGKWCTLAVCTPNHLNAQLDIGDWILGHSIKLKGNELIYAMKINEILDFDEYYNDSRFQYKKPKLKGKWWEISGDNIYYKDKKGKYTYKINPLHKNKFEQDVKNHIVFISNYFYYFGSNSVKSFKKEFPKLIHKTESFSYEREEEEMNIFIKWLENNFKRGRNGNNPTEPFRKSFC